MKAMKKSWITSAFFGEIMDQPESMSPFRGQGWGNEKK